MPRDNIISIHNARPIPADDYRFAEQHQPGDPDEAYRDSVFAEIRNALFWIGLGAIGGSFAVVLSAWIIAHTVLS